MASGIPHLLFLLLPLVVCAQNNGRIPIGSSLTAGDAASSPWRSPSDDFAFGFQELGNDLFLLCIWFNKLPEKTVVWYAQNDDNPAPRGSKVLLTASDGLLLQNPQGGELWKPDVFSGTVAFGRVNDTGNFMLLDSSSEPLWESFKHPKDTLLPAQTMELNVFLFSRKSQSNYSQGRFQFRLLDGDAVLSIVNLPTLHAYDRYFSEPSSDGNQIVFDRDGFLYIVQRNGSRVNINEPDAAHPAETHYYKLTLNFDGVLTVSHHPKNPAASNGSWTDLRKMPENICMAMRGTLSSGVCGFNSICRLNADQRPICRCPRGYSLIDPADEYGSCMLDIPQICEVGEENSINDLYELVELPNTDWPMLDYELFSPFSEEECKNACLTDCICVVSVYRGGSCWKKKLPLSNGRNDGTESSISYLKLRRNTSSTWQYPDLPVPREKMKKNQLLIVFSVLLGSSGFVILILLGFGYVGFVIYRKRKLGGNFISRETFESSLHRFTYQELAEATNGFKEELGRGSCGIVYKGLIETGAVAVKKLDRVFEDSDREFRTEMNVIGKTHHKSLIRLLGYCDEGKNRILIYEFMSGGTLAKFLFSDMKPSWNLRTQIAHGIARGLFYLHEECGVQIIHCDIKPQNVLLDEYYNAKISDFGLAKLLKMDQSRTETGIRGTRGYVAPDWFRSIPVTPKVDVYSFGVLLLEIICCRRNGDMESVKGGRGLILVDWAYDCLQDGNLEALVEGDEEAIDDMRRLERFVMVGIWCVQEDTSLRPTMKKVMLMLEGLVQVSAPPSPCPFTFTFNCREVPSQKPIGFSTSNV